MLLPGFSCYLFMLLASFRKVGAHVTVYVMAAEAFPGELRGALCGLSSFSEKCGALFATIVFSYNTTDVIFYIFAGSCVIVFFFNILFSDDYTHVSLS